MPVGGVVSSLIGGVQVDRESEGPSRGRRVRVFGWVDGPAAATDRSDLDLTQIAPVRFVRSEQTRRMRMDMYIRLPDERKRINPMGRDSIDRLTDCGGGLRLASLELEIFTSRSSVRWGRCDDTGFNPQRAWTASRRREEKGAKNRSPPTGSQQLTSFGPGPAAPRARPPPQPPPGLFARPFDGLGRSRAVAGRRARRKPNRRRPARRPRPPKNRQCVRWRTGTAVRFPTGDTTAPTPQAPRARAPQNVQRPPARP